MRSKITKIIPIILSLLIFTSGCKPNISKMPQDEAVKYLLNRSSEYYALHTHESSTLNISLSGELYGNQVNTLMTQTVNATTLYKDQENFSKLVNTHTERSNNENQTDDDIIDYTEGYSNGILFTSRDTQAESAPVNLKYQLTLSEYSDYCDNLNKDDPNIDLLVCGIAPSVEKKSDSWVISYNNISQEAKCSLEQWALTTLLDGIPTNITLTSFSVVYTVSKKIEAVTNTQASLTFTTNGDSDTDLDLAIDVNADLTLPESTELNVLPENIDEYRPCDSPDAMVTVFNGIKDLQHANNLQFRSDVTITLQYMSMNISKYTEQNIVEFDHNNGKLIYDVSSLVTNITYGAISNNIKTYDIVTSYDGQTKTITTNDTEHSTEKQNQWTAMTFISELIDPCGVNSSDVIGITYYPVDSGAHLVMLEYDATADATEMFESMGLQSPQISSSLGAITVDFDKDLNITNIQYEITAIANNSYKISCITNISQISSRSSSDSSGGTIM